VARCTHASFHSSIVIRLILACWSWTSPWSSRLRLRLNGNAFIATGTSSSLCAVSFSRRSFNFKAKETDGFESSGRGLCMLVGLHRLFCSERILERVLDRIARQFIRLTNTLIRRWCERLVTWVIHRTETWATHPPLLGSE